MVTSPAAAALQYRHFALLRAVAAGRCELSHSCVPDLYIDGRACCDQQATHLLASNGLIGHTCPGRTGQRVPATLTNAGRSLLAELDRPAFATFA
jgi:hypothetical protein